MIHYQVEATFEIVTPMFLGGANQETTRIRETSVKGALAFWWRAKNYAKIYKQSESDGTRTKEAVALVELKRQESQLFGGSTGEGASGQGVFLLKVEHIPLVVHLPDNHEVVGDGAVYMGYGLMDPIKGSRGKLTRSAFAPKQKFLLKILFRPGVEIDEKQQVIDALRLFGLVGGLGSRTRRGWGGVCLCKLLIEGKEDKSVQLGSRDAWEKQMKAMLGNSLASKVSGAEFPLTAFAQETRVNLGTEEFSDGLSALDSFGLGLLKYRARGVEKGGKHSRGTLKVDGSFNQDRDWFVAICEFGLNARSEIEVPKRTAFGLPHNYFSQVKTKEKSLSVAGAGEADRRASPLMHKVIKVGEKYLAVALFFPNKFTPDNRVKIQFKEDASYSDYQFDGAIITDFLDGYKHDDKARDGTPREQHVYFKSTRVAL